MTKNKQIFYFERGAYFRGYMTYIIEKRENKYFLKTRGDNGFFWLPYREYEIAEEDVKDLATVLEPVKKWEKKYEDELENILDGYGWSINYRFKTTRIKSQGYEQYPNGFRRVIKDIQAFLEQLGSKYDEEYFAPGLEERMRL